MVLTSKFGCGCSCPTVQYAASSEVARQCGNTLVLLDVHTQQQRLLVAGGQGIQSFCCNAKVGLVAVAEQGYKPRVVIHRQSDLKQLQSIQADAEFAYTAVALSHDGELLAVCTGEPDRQLSVWHWRKKQKLAAATLEHAVSSISFHPADLSCLIAVPTAASDSREPDSSQTAPGDGPAAVQLWRLDKLWSRHELHAIPLQLPADCSACSCHAWAPEGLYLGCRNGAVACIDPETSAVLGVVPASADITVTAAGVSSIAVNKDAVVVASSSAPQLMLHSRAPPALPDKQQQPQQPPSMQLLGSVPVSTRGCESVCFGGNLLKELVASTTDGSLLLLTRNSNSSNPTDMQVDPLADCHIGPITGLAAAPDGAHISSCGSDGAVRVWAAASGHLVGKRDLGARLTCCAVALGSTAAAAASKPVLAVGSEGGVIRLLAIAEPQRLPVFCRSRLHQSAVTHVAFNPGGTCLAVAAAADKRVALLGLRGCEHVDMLGYYTAAEHIQSLCWFSTSATSQSQLLISLAGGGLLCLTAPTQPYSSTQQQQDPTQALALSQDNAIPTAAEVPLLQLASIPPSKAATTANSNGSNQQQQLVGAQVLGLGSDGQLHRLLLPADAAGWANVRGKILRSIAKVQLSMPSTAIAVSPGGHLLLLASQDGSLTTLPAASAAAMAAAAATASNSNSTGNRSSVAAGGGNAAAVVHAHGSAAEGAATTVLAWSAGGQWAASAAQDGSFVLHAAAGVEHQTELPKTLPFDSSSIEDQEVPDDPSAPTVPDAAAAAAAAEAYNAGAAARQDTLQKLQTLQGQLAEVMQANAAAAADQRLSDAELILNIKQLEEMQKTVDAEVSALLRETVADTQVKEIRAQRLKALCWDSMQTKGAVCTGLKSGSTEVWNFPLPAQDDARWAKIANLRRNELIAAASQGLPTADQLYGSDTTIAATGQAAPGAPQAGPAGQTNSSAATTAPVTPGARGPGGEEADADSAAGSISMAGSTTDGSTASARESLRDSGAPSATAAQQLLAKIGDIAAKDCKARDLLYPELDATYPGRKLTQAELYRRMVWELKSQFNEEFNQLTKQKHNDADRLADLASRMDELIRELVKIHLVLNPTASAAQASSTGPPTAQSSAVGAQSSVTAAAGGSAAESSAQGAGASSGDAEVISGEQLAAELSVGRLTAHWSPLEDLEDMLLHVKPGEVKAPRYLSPAERAKAAADEAAAEAARRRVAADDSADRGLKQMMGGKLERATDEVAELVASRPAWMSGDPATFNEEQLREYKEYCAKEQAAIEERLKRKAVMETELRTLKASAEDIASKFDEAVTALAAKRLDLQMESAALECRILRLVADYEVAAVTAGRDAEQQAIAKLQEAQEKLATLERDLSETQELQAQQQEALSTLQAEARAHDRAIRSEFAEADSSALPKLISLYKNRIAPGPGTADAAAGGVASTHAAAPGSAEPEFQPLNFKNGAVLIGSAAGGGAAAAAAASGAGGAGGLDLRGPLGPAPVHITALSEAQMPEGLDAALWEKFVEYRSARGQIDVALREQSAKLAWLQRQHELLASDHLELSRQVETIAEELEVLRTRRAAAIFDVELQLRLKQGQVECSPAGVTASVPDALLVGKDQVTALNSSILAKGNAKLDLMKQMKEFKRGIYQLEWENKKFEMEAEDVISLTQQLQLLHVTKDFQQLVKGTHSTSSPAGKASAAAGASGGGQSAANKEVQSLENLLQVRETLHQKAVAEKRRQLRRIEGMIAAKQNENASVALQLSGLEKLLDDRSRLEGAVAAGDPGPDRTMRTLMMQRKLHDIAAAQAAEIAAAEAELSALQQRSFPCFPGGGIAGAAADFIPALSVAASTSSHLPSASHSPKASAGARYGGGVVASPGGSFAPSGSRGLKPVAPTKAVAGDTKMTGSPKSAGTGQPGKLVAPRSGRR